MLPREQQQALSDPSKAQANYDPTIHFDDPRLLQHLRSGAPNAGAIEQFLTLLAVCHTVIPETDSSTGAVAYRAASPDEEALVKAAKALGYDFQSPAPFITVKETACASFVVVRCFACTGLCAMLTFLWLSHPASSLPPLPPQPVGKKANSMKFST